MHPVPRRIYYLVQWLADLIEAPGYAVSTRLRAWLYKYQDNHCVCANCEKRRDHGLQGPVKKWWRL